MDDKIHEDNRVGALLRREGLVNETQLNFALSVQAAKPTYRPLGDILTCLGYVSRHKLHQLIQAHRKQILLGELLLKMGTISYEQLREAIGIQKRNAKRLGRILMEKGFVKRGHIADAISLQLGIACANAAECQVDRELLDKVNMAFLRARKVMPLRYAKEANTVLVLMEDPTDQETLADLQKSYRADIEPVMLRDGWIEYLLDGVSDAWNYASWRKPRPSGKEPGKQTLSFAMGPVSDGLFLS